MKKARLISLLILTIIGAGIIFYRYGTLPADLTRDEIEFARLTVKLSQQTYTPYDSYATGHATLYFYVLLASFKTFGLSPLALRFPAAVFGFLSIIAMYTLLRLSFHEGEIKITIPILKKRMRIETAFLLAAVFAATRWHFNFARFSFEGTFLVFLELVSLVALFLFERKRRLFFIVLAAVFSGLAYNSYQPGRFFLLVPLSYLIISPRLRTIRNFVLFGGVFAAVITPLSIYLMYNPDTRIIQQLYFLDPNLQLQQKMVFLGENIVRLVQMFTVKGDVNGLHNYPLKPALEPVVVILFLTGLFFGIVKKRTPMHIVFSIYLCLSLLPTLLTYPHENPNMLRTITAVPSIIYFLGLGIAYVLELSRKARKLEAIVPLTISIVLLIAVVSDMRTYFVYQKRVFAESFEVKDGFAGVYTFMHAHGIPIAQFRPTQAEETLFDRLKPQRNQ